MSTDDFIAMPPPGMPVHEGRADDTSAAQPDGVDFISLPPGIALDSGTFTVPARTPPARDPAPEVVFVPTVIGATPAIPEAETSAPPTAPVAVHVPQPVWSFVFPDGGAVVTLDAATLVGRNPAASVDWPDARLLPIADTTKSVSKTHALLEIDGGVLWVHDLDSTNGVYVVVGEEVAEVTPGTRAAVPAGADLELGEYVIRVERTLR